MSGAPSLRVQDIEPPAGRYGCGRSEQAPIPQQVTYNGPGQDRGPEPERTPAACVEKPGRESVNPSIRRPGRHTFPTTTDPCLTWHVGIVFLSAITQLRKDHDHETETCYFIA